LETNEPTVMNLHHICGLNLYGSNLSGSDFIVQHLLLLQTKLQTNEDNSLS